MNPAATSTAPPSAGAPEPTSGYYGQPVLKAPVWSWEIPLYFFIGGMAGASTGLAYASELRGDPVAARRAWSVALAGLGVSPALLISDLGRPTRFLNMLRMVKVTSPMSVGSWALSLTGAATAIAAASAHQVVPLPPVAGRIASPVAATGGLAVATYTAALIATTAVPAWHDARVTLPFVFASGAAMSAGGACAAATPLRHGAAARRLALIGAAAELASTEVMHRRLGTAGEVYGAGRAGRWARVSQAAILAGGALMAARGQRRREAAVLAGGLLCAGALATRWSVFAAGRASAADPRYVVEPQRAGRQPDASER